MTLRGRRTIRLSEPVPCGIISGDAICGKPATAAYANPAGTLPGYQQLGLTDGEWVILPVCADCARETRAVYEPEVAR
jgi:hypothetical protein